MSEDGFRSDDHPEPERLGRSSQALEASQWPLATIVATNSVSLQDRFELTGDLLVTNAASGAVLSSGAEFVLGHDSTLNGSATADSIVLRDRAEVTGDAFFNSLSGNGTVQGFATSPLSLPLPILVPSLPPISAGSTNVHVPQG